MSSRIVNADSFVIVPGWLIEKLRDADCPPKAIHVYLALGTWADNKTGECFPARLKVAARAGVSESTLDRCTAWLIKAGALTRIAQTDSTGGPASNLWIVHRATPRGGVSGDATPPQGSGHPGVNGASRGGVTGEALTTPSGTRPTELEGDADASPAGKRPDQLLFEAVATACYGTWDKDALPADARGRVNSAKAQLIEIGATPAMVEAAARAYRRKFRDTALTPQALTGNWPLLVRANGSGRATDGETITGEEWAARKAAAR